MIASEELQSLVSCLSSVLSELESRVLSLYLDGYCYEVIGERLECDTKTVDNALQRVKRKVASTSPRARCCSRAGSATAGRCRVPRRPVLAYERVAAALPVPRLAYACR